MLELKGVYCSDYRCKYDLIGEIDDYFPQFSYVFEYKKIYGLISEIGDGAWGISWSIAGILKNDLNKIFLDKVMVTESLRQRYIQAVGVLPRNFKVKKYLEQSYKSKLIPDCIKNKSINEIISFFNLKQEWLSKRFYNLEFERYLVSTVIGLMEGKTIFCFPWVSSSFIERNIDWLGNLFDSIKQLNGIIILPASRLLPTKMVVDEVIHIRKY